MQVHRYTQPFIEIRFPTNISYGARGGPAFSTNVITSHTGYEWRKSNWNMPLARYNVAHGVKNDTQLSELISFFRICQGKIYAFRFKDWMDYKVEKQLLAITDGKQKIFPLYKQYHIGEASVLRRITKPVIHSIEMKLADIRPWEDDYVIDCSNGIIQFHTPPDEGEELVISYQFDVPVRFDIDHLSASMDSLGNYSWTDIPLVEIRL